MTDRETMWQTYSKDIHRFAYRLCNDPTLAEDLTSETFVRVWTRPVPLRPSTIKAYLFTVTRNLFLAHCRKEGRQTSLSEELASPSPNQEQALTHKQDQKRMTEALQYMREGDRTALLLRSELSYEELAVVLGVSITAAKVKVHRARLRLKEILANQERKKWKSPIRS